MKGEGEAHIEGQGTRSYDYMKEEVQLSHITYLCECADGAAHGPAPNPTQPTQPTQPPNHLGECADGATHGLVGHRYETHGDLKGGKGEGKGGRRWGEAQWGGGGMGDGGRAGAAGGGMSGEDKRITEKPPECPVTQLDPPISSPPPG